MKPPLLLPSKLSILSPHLTLCKPISPNSRPFLTPKRPTLLPILFSEPLFLDRRRFLTLCSFNSSPHSNDSEYALEIPASQAQRNQSENQWSLVEIKNPKVPLFISSWSSRFSLSHKAAFLLTFIACTTSLAFVSFVSAAVPTLYAMGKAATSFAKLADTAREELPGTMAAIRLSGMEISDLTLELSDLSQEINEGVSKSAQAVRAAEIGLRQMGSLARQQTASLIQERAINPISSLQPVVSSAAKKTSRVVHNAARTFMNMFSEGESLSENKEDGHD